MCPRVKKSRLNIDPESLLPKLPDLSDLRPYPNAIGLRTISGSNSPITCMDINSTGHWILTGYYDGTITLSDTIIGRIYGKWNLSNNEARINCISWNPASSLSSMASVACGSELLVLNLFIGTNIQESNISLLFLTLEKSNSWNCKVFESMLEKGPRITLKAMLFSPQLVSNHDISRIAWHKKGDYLASVRPKGRF